MLTIEKVVKLLDDFHFEIFCNYLRRIKATIPLSLIQAIDRDVEINQETETLCDLVYQDSGKKTKQKFFQLAHYTFKLTSFLSRNYPNYLGHNIAHFDLLIIEGKLQKAKTLAVVLKDVAEKVEEFALQIAILERMAQTSVIFESFNKAVKIRQTISKLLNYQQIQNELIQQLDYYFNAKGKNFQQENKEELLIPFLKHHQHKSVKINSLSKYGYIYALSILNDERFFLPTTLELLKEVEDNLRKYDYVIFPFMFDISFKVAQIKLRLRFSELSMEEVLEECNKMMQFNEDTLFWKSFVDAPQMYWIAVQTSFYASTYMHSYRKDAQKLIPPFDQKRIHLLKQKCEALLEKEVWEDQFIVKYINLKTIYTGLLLLGDKKEINRAVNLLEEILVVYQQVPFHPWLDAIFAGIVIGNFSLERYDRVSTSYKRYKKLTDGRSINLENDLTIQGFYFASQWINTSRKQYRQKFLKVIDQLTAPNLQRTKDMLLELARYFDLRIN